MLLAKGDRDAAGLAEHSQSVGMPDFVIMAASLEVQEIQLFCTAQYLGQVRFNFLCKDVIDAYFQRSN